MSQQVKRPEATQDLNTGRPPFRKNEAKDPIRKVAVGPQDPLCVSCSVSVAPVGGLAQLLAFNSDMGDRREPIDELQVLRTVQSRRALFNVMTSCITPVDMHLLILTRAIGK